MKLNIFPPESSHGVKASFFFGAFEGTMLLAMSRRAVELLREEQPKHSSDSEPEQSDDDGYIGYSFAGYRNKDAKSTSKLTGEKQTLGDVADPWGVQAARAKRQMTDAAKQEEVRANRVYFQFVCNKVEGYPVVDYRNEHVGHLDFDHTGLAAKGVLYLPTYLGNEAQPISIFKVAEKPASGSDVEPRPW
ncbi:hypothetical protein VTK56DRAFT_5821 [Thermocarpiscus australiensis]